MLTYDFEHGDKQSFLKLGGIIRKENYADLKRIVANSFDETSLLTIDFEKVTRISSECRSLFHELLKKYRHTGTELIITGSSEMSKLQSDWG
jgi:anti-anti-sigma regulatory factor